MPHEFKLWAVYDPEDCRIITEGDISNSDSNVPWLKDKDGKEELEDFIAQERPYCRLARVTVEINECKETPA